MLHKALFRYGQFDRHSTKMTLSRQEHIQFNGQSRARLVLVGQWLYDNIAPMPVQIFAINYDYYYEMHKQEGCLEDGQEPELNEDGEMYIVAWHNEKFFSFAGSTDYGSLTIDEAKASAERVVKQIEWTEPGKKEYAQREG